MITLTFAWWWVPLGITIASIVWAVWIYNDGTTGYLSELGNLFMLIPAMAVSMIAWIIAAFLK